MNGVMKTFVLWLMFRLNLPADFDRVSHSTRIVVLKFQDVSNSAGLQWILRICIFNYIPNLPILMVWGPDFEIHTELKVVSKFHKILKPRFLNIFSDSKII